MSDMHAIGYREEYSPFGDPDAHNPDPEVRKRFLGKYRGVVANNIDPMGQGRLLVEVPDVLGLFTSSWALPCLPFAGLAMGTYVVPEVGTGVWVEFEQGDSEKPIWVGCFWGPPHSLPIAAAASEANAGIPVVTIETPTGGLSVCDTPIGTFGNVCIRSGESMISLTEAGVQITAPSVSITTSLFSINDTAFSVAGA